MKSSLINLSKKTITILLLFTLYLPINLNISQAESVAVMKDSAMTDLITPAKLKSKKSDKKEKPQKSESNDESESKRLADKTSKVEVKTPTKPTNNEAEPKLKKSDFIYDFFRMQYLTRWHMYNNSKYENLEEHSFETAIIVMTLAYISNTYYGGNFNAEHLAILALFHDYPETVIGDIPSPTHYNPDVAKGFEKLEAKTMEKLVDEIPSPFKDKFGPYIDIKNEDEKTLKLLKAADKISALIKCLREKQMGNIDFENAKIGIIKGIHKLNLPEAEYFLKNCMGGFDFVDVTDN